MKKVMEHVKSISSILAAILIIAVVIVPYILLIFYLRKSGQTISIYPKFEIKSIERTDNVNADVLNDSVRHAEELLKKLRGE